MTIRDKLLSWESLPAWRAALRDRGGRLVMTNGCFDILHVGHVTYLEAARNQGEALLVGVNGDASVRALKGPGRPINTEGDRAAVVAALASVDAVCIFQEKDVLKLLEHVRPEVYAKGGDYTLDTIHQPERRLVESMGGTVVVLGGVPGKSTSEVMVRMGKKPGDPE